MGGKGESCTIYGCTRVWVLEIGSAKTPETTSFLHAEGVYVEAHSCEDWIFTSC